MSLGKRIGQGFIEETVIDDVAFNMQYQSYQRSGYALDLNSGNVLGSMQGYVAESTQNPVKKKKTDKDSKFSSILSSLQDYGSDDDDNAGPWAKEKAPAPALPPIAPSVASKPAPTEVEEPVLPDNVHIVAPDEDHERWERKNERRMAQSMPPRPGRGAMGVIESTSTFHGEAEKDFEGRAWSAVPKGVHADGGDHECFIPKRCLHTKGSHTRGVQGVEFIPNTGHLLLSYALDGKAKIWRGDGNSELLRTYSGHSEGIRSGCFSPQGDTFLTSSFDRCIRLWDVETGSSKCFGNKTMGYSARYYPRNPSIFIVACSDNKLYQWDSRVGDSSGGGGGRGGIVQEYNYHLAPVNTVTFIDDGRKIVSTSDDKKILVWEFDVPVPIHYIQDPLLPSITFVAPHPQEDFIVGQSMDNSIVTYTSGEKVKAVKKKTFKGHANIGYAAQLAFSPNGKYLCSGDGGGNLFVWDFKTGKNLRRLGAHDSKPCMGVAWHPLLPSRVATGGWDGLVKVWE